MYQSSTSSWLMVSKVLTCIQLFLFLVHMFGIPVIDNPVCFGPYESSQWLNGSLQFHFLFHILCSIYTSSNHTLNSGISPKTLLLASSALSVFFFVLIITFPCSCVKCQAHSRQLTGKANSPFGSLSHSHLVDSQQTLITSTS